MSFLNKNCCDGIYKSFDVHFTKHCDNKCAFCVDKGSITLNHGKPDWEKIVKTIYDNREGMDDVLFLGGEPCLYLDELFGAIRWLSSKTDLKLYVTSAMPKTCFDKDDIFRGLLSRLNGFNISAQHYKEGIADFIRGTISSYDRQKYYNSLPYKENIRINLNIVRGYLDTKEELVNCIKHYDLMEFNSIKLSEIQHSTDNYISFEDIFNTKFKSPYSGGCQHYLDTKKILGIDIKTPVLLKRSCFICENSLTASFLDGIKVFSKYLLSKPLVNNHKYGVVYEDGTLSAGWIKEN